MNSDISGASVRPDLAVTDLRAAIEPAMTSSEREAEARARLRADEAARLSDAVGLDAMAERIAAYDRQRVFDPEARRRADEEWDREYDRRRAAEKADAPRLDALIARHIAEEKAREERDRSVGGGHVASD